MHRQFRLRPPLFVAVLLLFATALALVPRTAQAARPVTITVDGTKPGRVFDGVGAISGGGGNSRLLADYPEPQRSQLLDYLFKPGSGAALQILKLEVGGDTNSTDGAEASHMHTADTVDCNQGYEWWLAGQAKKRNPDIKLVGLSWGAPGWINPSSNSFFTDNAVNYLMQWMGCATQHGLTIDYLGGWNERGYDAAWYKKLKSTLVAGGYTTKVVAAEDSWAVADALAADPAFKSAVDVVGVHYPCGYLSSATNCSSPATAQALGTALWASENGSLDTNSGAAAVARGINRGYIDGRMTAYINWPAISALYPNLYFSTDGMSVANQPWSGHYDIGRTTWVTAQTTQFTRPGWRYIDSGSGYLSGNRNNGSFVSLKSGNNADYTTVIETLDAGAAQTVNFQIAGGLPTGQVHVWATNVNSADSAYHFVHLQNLTPSAGGYQLTLQPGFVYTVSTTTGQGKTVAPPPAGAPMSLPYSDSFDTPATTTSPKYFADMNGAFQSTACGGGRSGTCLRQMAPATPVRWTDEKNNAPYTIMGDGSWSNYTVSADALLEQAGGVELLGRVNQQARNNNGLNAYHFRVNATGAWSLVRTDLTWNEVTLASGTTGAVGTGSWHNLTLAMQGTQLTAGIDGTQLTTVTDGTIANGQAGLGTAGYQTQQFDNFALRPGTSTPPRVGPVLSGIPGKCLDAGSATSGAKVQLWSCNQSPAQTWTWAAQTLTHNGLCLDVVGQGTVNGTGVDLWSCNNQPNQQWLAQADGTLKGAQSGLCLDDPDFSTTDGTQLVLWTCNGGANQRWTLP